MAYRSVHAFEWQRHIADVHPRETLEAAAKLAPVAAESGDGHAGAGRLS